MKGSKQWLRGTTGLMVGLLFAVTSSGFAQAATPGAESITLSPVSRQYKLDAGETRLDELTVINDGAVAYDFKVYAQPYSVKGDSYDPDFVTKLKNTDVDAWIKTEKSSYHAKPNEVIKVKYTLTVPEDATPGGHYGVIFAETQPVGGTNEGAAVERKKRVGTIIYATVNGQYEMGGKVTSSDIPGLQFKAPLTSSFTVQNTGSSDFATDVNFEVADLFGNKKFVAEKSYQVLPQTSRRIPLEWAQAPGFGLFKVTIKANFLDQDFNKTGYVLMAPIWAYMVGVVLILGAIIAAVQRRR